MEKMVEEELYWYWMCNIQGVGRKTLGKLMDIYQNPENLYKAPDKEIEKLLKPKVFEQFISSKDWERVFRNYQDMRKRNITFLWPKQEQYPEKLRHLHDYPFGLYLKGKLPPKEKPAIAIVGARKAGFYGLEMAQYMGRELAKMGFSIISGLAGGVDSYAHKGALAAGGYTLGILGCGVNICYPKENYDIYCQMENTGGILSEYRLHTEPKAGLFPLRNRLIAAFADGILVTEARSKSGALITVDQGLELGRDIFALPGRTCDVFSEGCNTLIKNGAKMVTEVSDIWEEYQTKGERFVNFQTEKKNTLVKIEKMLYSCLRLEPKYIDTIIEETRLSISELVPVLMSLEKKGYIRQIKRNYYSVTL